MRAFAAVGRQEGELAGAVVPVALDPTGQRQDVVGQRVDGEHQPLVPARSADAAGQRQHGACTAHGGRHRHQPSCGLPPPGGRRQHHAVERDHQEHDGRDAMHLTPQVIRKPPPKRQHHQRHQDPDRPFPDVLGGPAEHVQPGCHARRLGHRVKQRKQQRFANLDQVMRRGKGRRQDAAPLVQAIHLVQAAQPGFDPSRADRQ